MSDAISRLIPMPREIALGEGEFAWTNDLVIVVEPGCEADLLAAQTLVEACRERGLSAPATIEARDLSDVGDRRPIIIGDPCSHPPLTKALREESTDFPGSVADQGYTLTVTADRILIAGIDRAGVYYGVQTLIQLLPEHSGAVQCLRASDWITVPLRGISMDLYSGEIYTMDLMKRNIRRLAHYKLNLLVLYLEDAFEFPSHRDIGELRDRLTTLEVRELDEFARGHHVELVPCYDSPGHMFNTLNHPNYKYLREGTEIDAQKAVINITHPDAYPLLRDLYGDLCRAFSSEMNYVSGDEALSIGTGASKGLADEIGKANMFVGYLKKMREIAAEYGKRIAVAGDPFEPGFFKTFGLDNYGVEALKQLPRDVIVGPWHYGDVPEFEFGNTLNELGFDQILWTSNAAFYELYPDQNTAAANVESFVPYAHSLHAMGMVHSDWNGWQENTFSEYNWPAIAFYADWAWASPARPWAEALPVAVESFYGPGTASLANTIRFLSDSRRYFGWGAMGMNPPAWTLFFREVEAHQLGTFIEPWKDENGVEHTGIGVEEAQTLLDDFRRDLGDARAALKAAKESASRNAKHLDYVEFALDQYEALGNIVECRHLMAQTDRESRERLGSLLRVLSLALPALIKRYKGLWRRTSRPLGLEGNVMRFEAVLESVRARTMV
jgi:hypothetical protein